LILIFFGSISKNNLCAHKILNMYHSTA